MKKLILLLMAGCTYSLHKEPERTVIEVHPDGSSTVFNRFDSGATIVNLNPNGELLDSTWMLTDKPLDSIIKYYK